VICCDGDVNKIPGEHITIYGTWIDEVRKKRKDFGGIGQ
jgi:hypothetical protein